eukprot:gene18885-38008_t
MDVVMHVLAAASCKDDVLDVLQTLQALLLRNIRAQVMFTNMNGYDDKLMLMLEKVENSSNEMNTAPVSTGSQQIPSHTKCHQLQQGLR